MRLGAFVMGVTPAQSVATMFSYARAQGLTRIAVVARESPLGAASIAAARGIAQAGGISLTVPVRGTGNSSHGNVVRWDESQSRTVFQALQDSSTSAIKPIADQQKAALEGAGN